MTLQNDHRAAEDLEDALADRTPVNDHAVRGFAYDLALTLRLF